MAPLHVDLLLDSRGANGVLPCACGREHRIAAGQVLVGEGALARAADLLARRYGAVPAVWILSDDNTEAAAGQRWKSSLRGAAIRSRVLPAAPKPVPTLALAEELGDDVRRAAPDLLVAVGAGVVSDLVKRISLDVGRPNWCIATAPSVDAYSSATSSLRVAGYHRAVLASSSEVIVCDLDVFRAAPRMLLLAGLGDLLAKFVAYLDWNVAHLVTGEHFCPAIADRALLSARVALRAARELEADPDAAVVSLTDAILVSGFAMQALGDSRAAASAEHTIAHFWETTHAVKNRASDLHGILVGAATRLMLPGYREFYRRLPEIEPDIAARLSTYASEPPWREQLEDGMDVFAEAIAGEMRGRSLDGVALVSRLEAFVREKERIAGLAGPLLDELSQALGALERLGFPARAAELGIPEPLRHLPVRNVRLLRNRYTSFDLAYELGCESLLADAIAASPT